MRQGRAWKDWCAAVGYVGDVRALEVTHGQNGWHPHVHAVMLFERPLSEAERRWLRERWLACVEAELGREHRPDYEHGLDVRPAYKADYISKLGLELTDAVGAKQAKNGNRAPLRIAEDYAKRGREEDAVLWRAYCKGMFRAKMLTWSKGLRDRYGLGKEQDDTELAADPTIDSIVVARIPGREWDALRDLPGARTSLLEAAEVGIEALACALGPPSVTLRTNGAIRRSPGWDACSHV